MATGANVQIIETGRNRQSPPQALCRHKAIQLGHYTGAVCYHEGFTYVGLDRRGVGKLDKFRNLNKDFINLIDFVDSIVVLDNMIYVLIWKSNFFVSSYDMSGLLLVSWLHDDLPVNNAKNKMAVFNGNIIIARRLAKVLVLYSSFGELLKAVPCPLLDLCSTDICTLDSERVAVSVYQTDTIFCMNMNTSEVLWKCTSIWRPRALVCYGLHFLLVSTDVVPSEQTVYVLNSKTG